MTSDVATSQVAPRAFAAWTTSVAASVSSFAELRPCQWPRSSPRGTTRVEAGLDGRAASGRTSRERRADLAQRLRRLHPLVASPAKTPPLIATGRSCDHLGHLRVRREGDRDATEVTSFGRAVRVVARLRITARRRPRVGTSREVDVGARDRGVGTNRGDDAELPPPPRSPRTPRFSDSDAVATRPSARTTSASTTLSSRGVLRAPAVAAAEGEPADPGVEGRRRPGARGVRSPGSRRPTLTERSTRDRRETRSGSTSPRSSAPGRGARPLREAGDRDPRARIANGIPCSRAWLTAPTTSAVLEHCATNCGLRLCI